QGGASGSTGIQSGGKQMRMAAAEARRVLVEMAAEKLKIQADQLAVTDGVVHAKSDTAKKASYADLIGGRYFNVQLEWNKQIGNALYAPGKAQPKSPKDYKIVGKPMKRADVAPKVFCQENYVTDLKVPGMVHARIIAEGEWDAIPGARKLKVEWSDAKPPFPAAAALYDHIRRAPVRKRQVEGKEAGNVDEAFKNAARIVEAEYEWPFQSHACMGPACAIVEIT